MVGRNYQSFYDTAPTVKLKYRRINHNEKFTKNELGVINDKEESVVRKRLRKEHTIIGQDSKGGISNCQPSVYYYNTSLLTY